MHKPPAAADSPSQSEISQPEIIAAVDLGSNSFHMIVGELRHGQLAVIDRIRETVRLAEGLSDRMAIFLTDARESRALTCLVTLRRTPPATCMPGACAQPVPALSGAPAKTQDSWQKPRTHSAIRSRSYPASKKRDSFTRASCTVCLPTDGLRLGWLPTSVVVVPK